MLRSDSNSNHVRINVVLKDKNKPTTNIIYLNSVTRYTRELTWYAGLL